MPEFPPLLHAKPGRSLAQKASKLGPSLASDLPQGMPDPVSKKSRLYGIKPTKRRNYFYQKYVKEWVDIHPDNFQETPRQLALMMSAIPPYLRNRVEAKFTFGKPTNQYFKRAWPFLSEADKNSAYGLSNSLNKNVVFTHERFKDQPESAWLKYPAGDIGHTAGHELAHSLYNTLRISKVRSFREALQKDFAKLSEADKITWAYYLDGSSVPHIPMSLNAEGIEESFANLFGFLVTKIVPQQKLRGSTKKEITQKLFPNAYRELQKLIRPKGYYHPPREILTLNSQTRTLKQLSSSPPSFNQRKPFIQRAVGIGERLKRFFISAQNE